jgi:hypothetical protein
MTRVVLVSVNQCGRGESNGVTVRSCRLAQWPGPEVSEKGSGRGRGDG